MIFKIAPGTFLVEDTCNPLVRRSMLLLLLPMHQLLIKLLLM
jgi:hypothetical protein